MNLQVGTLAVLGLVGREGGGGVYCADWADQASNQGPGLGAGDIMSLIGHFPVVSIPWATPGSKSLQGRLLLA